MTVEGIDRGELERLAAKGALVTVPVSLLLALIVRIEQLEEKVASLERLLGRFLERLLGLNVFWDGS